MQPIIKVANLGKRYRLRGGQTSYGTLRDTLAQAVRVPFGRRRRNGESSIDDQMLWVLSDVSFEVAQGEILGIIGRNGAGKSTLLKILSRVTEPTTGRAELYGRVGSLLEVGTGFHPELTGRENISLNGAVLGMKRAEIERKFDEIVAFSEIEMFMDTPVKFYSSGMYMRLAFAIAAHLEPEILIVDEVLAVGDLKFQQKCIGKMGDITRQGRTVLIVTHNVGIVNSLCTRALYLADGRVRAHGPTEMVVADYLSEMVGNKEHDLDRLRPPGMGVSVRFLNISFKSANSESSTSNVEFAQPFEFILTIGAEEDISDLSIGSSVFNMLGVCVGSLITREQFSLKAGEVISLRLYFEGASLAPGSYYCGFSIGRGGRDVARSDFDAVVGAPSFQVLPATGGDDFFANWQLSWGSIIFKDIRLTVDNYGTGSGKS